MAQQVVIAGAMFEDVPSISVPDANNVYHPFLDTTIASNAAAASDIAQGKLAYVNGSLVTGTNQGGGGGAVKMGALRPDAELVQTWSYDKKIHADEGVTIPSYNTSNQTLKEAANQSTTYTLDPTLYNYTVLYRALVYPIYNSSNKGKGRQEYSITSGGYELLQYPAGTFKAIVDSTTSDSLSYNRANLAGVNVIVYWSGDTTLSVANQAYGAYTSASSTATIGAGNILTVSSPALYIRGNTSYLSSTYWGYITDIRYQWIFELYRSPLSASVKGWERMSQNYHMRDCVNGTSHTLT